MAQWLVKICEQIPFKFLEYRIIIAYFIWFVFMSFKLKYFLIQIANGLLLNFYTFLISQFKTLLFPIFYSTFTIKKKLFYFFSNLNLFYFLTACGVVPKATPQFAVQMEEPTEREGEREGERETEGETGGGR
jgi:hypothetical protein